MRLGRAARTGLKPVEQVRVADQDLAEILAGAEDLEQDLGRPGVFGQLVQSQPRGPVGLPMNRSRLVSAMPGSGQRGRTVSSWMDDPGDQRQVRRPGPADQVAQVAQPRSGSRTPSPASQSWMTSGSVMMSKEPVGVHLRSRGEKQAPIEARRDLWPAACLSMIKRASDQRRRAGGGGRGARRRRG